MPYPGLHYSGVLGAHGANHQFPGMISKNCKVLLQLSDKQVQSLFHQKGQISFGHSQVSYFKFNPYHLIPSQIISRYQLAVSRNMTLKQLTLIDTTYFLHPFSGFFIMAPFFSFNGTQATAALWSFLGKFVPKPYMNKSCFLGYIIWYLLPSETTFFVSK